MFSSLALIWRFGFPNKLLIIQSLKNVRNVDIKGKFQRGHINFDTLLCKEDIRVV